MAVSTLSLLKPLITLLFKYTLFMNTKYWTSGSGRIELRITSRDAKQCSHPGPCDSDVKELLQKRYIKKQVAEINPEILAKELDEYGAWDSTELANHSDNLTRLIWIAAGDIADGNN